MASHIGLENVIIFLTFYYTDVVGLPAVFVGTLFLLARVTDAIIDPLMGMVADRTRTRWGKFRP
jgi:GPH family glycoside/pentoside/hexuronide:cation symporter